MVAYPRGTQVARRRQPEGLTGVSSGRLVGAGVLDWARGAADTPDRKEDARIMSQVPRFRMFILGAGFSRPAGLPLGEELWRLVRSRASGRTGRAARFDHDLETYLRYRLECDGIRLNPAGIDFEDFLAFLDLEHYLGLAGSDTWSNDGNESQCMVKRLIGQILVECTPSADALPQLYCDFAEQLTYGDYVLSFNYDTVLERALEHVGRAGLEQ